MLAVRGMQIMVPSAKILRAKSAWPTWLSFCLLGLMATFCGLFLPKSFRDRPEPSMTVPAAEQVQEKKDALEYEPPPLPDVPTPSSMFLRLGLGTIFVVILCIVTLWAGKRWVRPLAVPGGEDRKLRILESLPLAARCSLLLLQAGETKVLVGLDQAGIKALLPLPQAFEQTLEAVNQQADDEPLRFPIEARDVCFSTIAHSEIA